MSNFSNNSPIEINKVKQNIDYINGILNGYRPNIPANNKQSGDLIEKSDFINVIVSLNSYMLGGEETFTDTSGDIISASDIDFSFLKNNKKDIIIPETADGTCDQNEYDSLFLDPTLMNRYSATRVKLRAKSYAVNTLACGGILFRVSETDVQQHPASSFDGRTLSRCGDGKSGNPRFDQVDTSSYVEFSFIPDSSYEIASNATLCSSSPGQAKDTNSINNGKII